ncbi:hypothetical protein GCM10028791_14050 [Echinicola sediminis]
MLLFAEERGFDKKRPILYVWYRDRLFLKNNPNKPDNLYLDTKVGKKDENANKTKINIFVFLY